MASRDATPFLRYSIPEYSVKKLLIMLVLSICAVAWRSEDILKAIGAMSASAVASPSPVTASAMTTADAGADANAMSVDDLARLSHTDPRASQKFIARRTVNERTEADKLMNFLTRGKYE
jgi:hypothetical protein